MALGREGVNASKTGREWVATRVTVVATVLGVLVVVADLAWLVLTTQRGEDDDLTWSAAASATRADVVWNTGIIVMTVIALWLLVVAVRHRAEHHREVTSTWRVYFLASVLTGAFSLFTGSLPGVTLSVVALGVVVAFAGRGPELTEHHRLLLRFERYMVVLLLTLFVAFSAPMLAFYAVGSDEASAPAREAWIADQGSSLTTAAQVLTVVLAVAYVAVVLASRPAAARIGFLPTQLALLGVATVAVSFIPGWWVPPAIAAVGFVVLLTVRRVPKDARLDPVSWSGGRGLM